MRQDSSARHDAPIPETVTSLLHRAEGGDLRALESVFDRLYGELRLLAERQRARWDGDFTMNATALVHEAYLKLVGPSPVDVRGRGHFFALASRAMRQILCNYARDRQALKRGGAAAPVTLDDLAGDGRAPPAAIDPPGTLLDLDDALERLGTLHPRASRVVECRFFGGLTVEETAAALDVSSRTVRRDWEFAQAWLQRELAR